MYKYLKEREYYIDLYDRHTVDECRQWEEICNKDDGRPMDLGKGKLTKEGRARFLNGIFELTVHYKKGERYERKEETISKWMDKDKQRDEFLENTKAPIVKCKTCFRYMEAESKDLWDMEDKRVMFMFTCPNGCMPNRSVFENGEDWVREPDLCPKCKKEMVRTIERKGDDVKTTYKCPACGHKIIDDFGASPKKVEVDHNFEKDRERFCLDIKEGL